MHGNVYEWCFDWFVEYAEGAVTDPLGPKEGVSRVDRGGCWGSFASFCRAAFRSRLEPSYRSYDLGFRPACVPSR